MANRRFGGGGGPPQKLGGFSQQNFQGNKVNPWQGGAAPSNALNSGLLSQLSAPQAQLALALTSLLQPQQQMNNNPPSLLSLPTSPAFGSQDNFGSHNRFNNRGRDFRRPEPYKLNQNRSGGNTAWRDNSTRPTGSYSGNRSLSSSNRSGSRSNFGNKDRKSPQRGGKGFAKPPNKAKSSDKAGDKVNESSKKPQKDAKSENDSLDESRDEDGEEKKRDWKQEKNGDDQKDDDETGLDSVDLTEEATGDEKKDKDKKPREGRYHGVPASLLHCFVCNKSMWDGESFQNHVRGKAHKQMMDSLGQSFQITVNILRENMRLVEEKKMIELERIHRNSRNFHRQQQEPQSHCNMCDLKFLGKIITHRKTEGHQRLKRFLHPKCHHCAQEFPSRMEWVDHRFTPDHLRKVKEIMETTVKTEDGAPLLEEETPEIENDPLLEESLQTEDDNPVLELTDDLKDLQNRIPAFKRTRDIGKKNVQPMSGFYCDICIRFMTSETAAQDHLRTEKHYTSFVDAAKKQYKRMNDEEKAAADRLAKKRKAEEEEESKKKPKTEDSEKEGGAEGDAADPEGKGDEMYDPEEACDDNEASLDNATLDEEFAEVDRLIKTVEEQEKDKPEVKEEAVPETEVKKEAVAAAAPEAVSPRGRRAATAAAVGGGVKNGAGPRSKTRRGGK